MQADSSVTLNSVTTKIILKYTFIVIFGCLNNKRYGYLERAIAELHSYEIPAFSSCRV